MHYFLGYPDTAFSKMNRAIQLADTVGHPLSRAAARTFTIQLLQWLRTDTGVSELATETISICEAHCLPFFRAWTDASLACRLISDGEVEVGRQKMAVALDAWIGSAGQLFVPYLRCVLAEAHALAGVRSSDFWWAASAADLKSLLLVPRVSVQEFQIESGTRIIEIGAAT